ncbi:MAG: hypothetical protein K6G26_12770 [Lachnospiraceae bacterium]|nr:hypothetical protein [Lachnospiraceae bacterium]
MGNNRSLDNFWNNSGGTTSNNGYNNQTVQNTYGGTTQVGFNTAGNQTSYDTPGVTTQYTGYGYSDTNGTNTGLSSVLGNTSYVTNDMAEEPHLTVGQWILTWMVLVIPVVNFIMLIYWSFKDTNPTRKTFARGTIFWVLVMITLSLVFMVVFYDTFNYATFFEKQFKVIRYAIKKISGSN